MTRPKGFIPEDALEHGMLLLWERGYEATSLDDILAAMHLSRSSFYDTFGSKHDFLLAAIDLYMETIGTALVKLLQAEGARAAIERTFLPPEDPMMRGCFVNNCAIEIAHRDPTASARIQRAFQRIEDAYFEAVVRGQKRGEISSRHDARSLARYLLNNKRGLVAMMQGGLDDEGVKQIKDVILSVLD
jgi:TetR/AcrR family transcriptional repressor of nem operon